MVYRYTMYLYTFNHQICSVCGVLSLVIYRHSRYYNFYALATENLKYTGDSEIITAASLVQVQTPQSHIYDYQ